MEAGFSWEADPKYVQTLVRTMNLENGKGVDAPSSKDRGKGDRRANDPLKAKEAIEFRSLAGTALYLSLDRPSIQFAVSEISSGMAAPTRLHEMKLKRPVIGTWQNILAKCGSSPNRISLRSGHLIV